MATKRFRGLAVHARAVVAGCVMAGCVVWAQAAPRQSVPEKPAPAAAGLPDSVVVQAGPVSVQGVRVEVNTVATVCHGLAGVDPQAYRIRHRDKAYPARLVAADQDRNVCLLEAEIPGVPALAFGQSRGIRAGDNLIAAGDGREQPAAVDLIVTSYRGRVMDGQYLGLDARAPVQDGMAVLDMDNRLVGLVVVDRVTSRPMPMALPVEWIRDVLKWRPRPPEKEDRLSWVPWMNVVRAFEARNDRKGWLRSTQDWTQARPTSAWAWLNLGNAWYFNGDNERALEAYEKATVLDPQLGHGWSNLGAVLVNLGRMQEAEAAYLAGVKADPTNSLVLHNLGNLYKKTGRVQQAVESWEAAARNGAGPNAAGALTALGIHYQKGPKAIEMYMAALEVDPAHGAAMEGLGEVWEATGEIRKAIDTYEAAARLEPNYAPIAYKLALAYEKIGEMEKALRLFFVRVSRAPGDGTAWLELGKAQFRRQKFQDAVDALTRARALGLPSDQWGTYLAESYAGLGQMDKAIVIYRDSLADSPKHPQNWVNLGNVYLRASRMEEAIRIFEQAREALPDSDRVAVNLAFVQAKAGQRDKALALARQVQGRDSRESEVWSGLGNFYLLLQMYDESIAAFGRATEIKPDAVANWIGLGDGFHFKKKWDEAIAAYRSALRLSPMDVGARSNLGRCLLESRQFDAAREELEQVLRIVPDHYHARINLSVVMIRSRQPGKALEILEPMDQAKPADALILSNLVAAYRRVGRREDAEKAYLRLKDVDAAIAARSYAEELQGK